MTAVVSRPGVDSPYAWRLAIVSMLCIALGGGGIYLPVIGLKEIAADFGDQRAVPSLRLHDRLLRHGRGRRVHGLAGRPHQSPGAAADRRRLDRAGRLGGCERQRAGALCRLHRPAGLLRQCRHLHAGHEQRAGLVRSRAQHRHRHRLGRARRFGHDLAADLSCAAARHRLAPDLDDLRRGGGGAPVRWAPSMCGRRRSCAVPADGGGARRRSTCRCPRR